MRRLRSGGLAFAVAVVVLFGVCLTAATGLSQTANVVARDSHGHVLGPDPLIAVGARVELSVTGFAPHAELQARLGSTVLGDYFADGHGRTKFSVVIPNLVRGEYVIATIGNPPIASRTPSVVSASNGNPNSDQQYLEALVPNLGLWVFHTDPGAHSTPPTTPPTTPTTPHHSTSGSGAGGASGSHGEGGGHVGNTGTPVLQLILLAAVSLLLGGVLAIGFRRRKPRRAGFTDLDNRASP